MQRTISLLSAGPWFQAVEVAEKKIRRDTSYSYVGKCWAISRCKSIFCLRENLPSLVSSSIEYLYISSSYLLPWPGRQYVSSCRLSLSVTFGGIAAGILGISSQGQSRWGHEGGAISIIFKLVGLIILAFSIVLAIVSSWNFYTRQTNLRYAGCMRAHVSGPSAKQGDSQWLVMGFIIPPV